MDGALWPTVAQRAQIGSSLASRGAGVVRLVLVPVRYAAPDGSKRRREKTNMFFMGKVARQGSSDILEALRGNPIIPAFRGLDEDLEVALSGDHPAVFVLGGNIFELIEKLERWLWRPPVCVNVDLIGGVAGDADGVGFLSQHVEGIISNNRHVIEFANTAGLVTIQRLFALDCGTIERGLKLVKRANPGYVEVLPAPAYPLVASYYPELVNWPVLAGGLIRSAEEVSLVLEAGAVGVSTGHLGLWRSV